MGERDGEVPSDLREQLNARGRRYSVAFGARAAARALTVLAASPQPFAAWKVNRRAEHLLAVLRAVSAGLSYSTQASRKGLSDSSLAAVTTFASDDAAYAARRADAADAAADAHDTAYATATDAHAHRAAADAATAAAAAADAAYAARRADAADAAHDTATADAAAYAADAARRAVYADAAQTAYAADAAQAYDLHLLDPTALLSEPLWPTSDAILTASKKRFVLALTQCSSGFDLWASWYEDLWHGRIDRTFAERVLHIPREILAQGPAAANAYLRSLAEATRPLNRVRAIFIGHGGAGKTSIIRALHDEPVIAGQEPMTPGIDIRTWPLPGTEIRADFWDFGGQVMAHATHQLFLRERCVYVVVLDSRAEVNANEQAQYWLEHIRAFGGSAPALVVGNKCDQVPVSIDENFLRQKYNLIGFYPLSCTQRAGTRRPEWQRFTRDFTQQLQGVGTHQLQLTPRHFAVLEELTERAQRETFLEHREFSAACDRLGVPASGELDREWLRDLLDKLGIIISFPKLQFVSAYLLNPRWLTYGIYTLFYAERTQRQLGRLSNTDVLALLSARELSDNLRRPLEYTPEHCGFIREAMLEFRLCYELPGGDLILPALLQPHQPELEFDEHNARVFDFDFEGFVPRHAMAEVIVRRHLEIVERKVWQNGVLLSSKSFAAQALARVDYQLRRISICVTGAGAGHFLSVLYDEMLEILARMPDLRWTAHLQLPESARAQEPSVRVRGDRPPRASYETLLAHEADGQRYYVCEHGKYSVAEVLSIMPAEQRRKRRGAATRVVVNLNGNSAGQVATQERSNSWLVPILVAIVTVLGTIAVTVYSKIAASPCEEGKRVDCPAQCAAGEEPKKLCSDGQWGRCECQLEAPFAAANVPPPTAATTPPQPPTLPTPAASTSVSSP